MFNAEVVTYLQSVKIPIRLSCTTLSNWPVVVSLWFLLENDHIYCATSQNAKVIRYLRNNPRCAFEVAGDLPPYRGVRGQAYARLEPERGPEVLEMLLHRYLGGTDSPLATKLLARRHQEVAICIEPINLFSWDFTKRMQDSLDAI